ncbi:MAG: tetratricopeptide repeat protein [Planctomycetaceae bacterium]|nr:tetratricopeptide repeat protein [Planctomycetaceae bacterium]
MLPHEQAALATGRRRRRFALAAGVGTAAAVACGLWLVARPTPTRLLEQGLLAARTDRNAAERLFRRALADADGQYPDAQMALCSLLARRESWDEALALFDTVDQQACRADLLLDFGQRSYRAGRRAPALEALNEVRRRHTPESVQALELLIFDYAEWERHQDLIDATRELARLQPDDPARWSELIDLLKSMNRNSECLTAIQEALRQDLPDDFQRDLRHQLVDRLIVSGDVAGAKREIAQLELDEGDSLRLSGDKLDLYRLEGDLEKALEMVTAIFPEIQDRPDAYYVRGTIYLDLGRFAEAAGDLKRAVTGLPFHNEAHFKLAQAYRALALTKEAERHRKLAARISEKRKRIGELLNQIVDDPQNRQICNDLAALHRELEEFELARRWEHRAARQSAAAGLP